MTMSQVIQQQSVYFSGSMAVLRYLVTQLTGTIEALDDKKLRAFQSIDITLEKGMVTLEVGAVNVLAFINSYNIISDVTIGNQLYFILQLSTRRPV